MTAETMYLYYVEYIQDSIDHLDAKTLLEMTDKELIKDFALYLRAGLAPNPVMPTVRDQAELIRVWNQYVKPYLQAVLSDNPDEIERCYDLLENQLESV